MICKRIVYWTKHIISSLDAWCIFLVLAPLNQESMIVKRGIICMKIRVVCAGNTKFQLSISICSGSFFAVTITSPITSFRLYRSMFGPKWVQIKFSTLANEWISCAWLALGFFRCFHWVYVFLDMSQVFLEADWWLYTSCGSSKLFQRTSNSGL